VSPWWILTFYEIINQEWQANLFIDIMEPGPSQDISLDQVLLRKHSSKKAGHNIMKRG
jgi:hypothetical protein